MPKVHFFDGDKGGVGKSFCCRTFIQLFLDKSIDFVPIEADRYNPDVANRYANLLFELAIFSDDERQTKADEIVEFAKTKPVIISLPSQVGKPLNIWLEDALGTANRNKITFVRWFITSGAYESLDLFYVSLKEHGANMHYVLVKNYGVGEDWSEIEAIEGLSDLMKKYKVKVIEFPKLQFQERNLLDKNNLALGDARTSPILEKLSVSRDRIEKFLKKAYKSFESTGLVP